jgi:hypothetical protein
MWVRLSVHLPWFSRLKIDAGTLVCGSATLTCDPVTPPGQMVDREHPAGMAPGSA